MTDNEIIREKIGIGEVLAQLAEEATELAQAALKYRRAITTTNPTPVTPEEALEHLREEIADVDLCLVVAGDLCEASDNEIFRMEAKRARWIERIKSVETSTETIGTTSACGKVFISGSRRKIVENRDGTVYIKEKPDCDERCAELGQICPHIRPDLTCEYDTPEDTEK